MLSLPIAALLAAAQPLPDIPIVPLAPPEPILVTDVAPPPIVALIAPPPPPLPPRFPPAVRAMIEQAIASGDEKAVAAVVRFAKQSVPAAADDIERMHKAFQQEAKAKKDAEEKAKREALAAAGPLEYWDGQAEFGASRSTGNTTSFGLYTSLSGNREGINWRHKFVGRAEVQETNGVTTTERVLLSWQPNYKFDERLYAFGIAQYEHDPKLGYESRYTGGGGIGYGVIARPRMKLDFEGGPALRYTDEVENGDAVTLAGRASLSFKWKLSSSLELSQNSALYYEPGESSASALTALDTRLFKSLKARFSYNLVYEGDAPSGANSIDTVTRATLVYSF